MRPTPYPLLQTRPHSAYRVLEVVGLSFGFLSPHCCLFFGHPHAPTVATVVLDVAGLPFGVVVLLFLGLLHVVSMLARPRSIPGPPPLKLCLTFHAHEATRPSVCESSLPVSTPVCRRHASVTDHAPCGLRNDATSQNSPHLGNHVRCRLDLRYVTLVDI